MHLILKGSTTFKCCSICNTEFCDIKVFVSEWTEILNKNFFITGLQLECLVYNTHTEVAIENTTFYVWLFLQWLHCTNSETSLHSLCACVYTQTYKMYMYTFKFVHTLKCMHAHTHILTKPVTKKTTDQRELGMCLWLIDQQTWMYLAKGIRTI